MKKNNKGFTMLETLIASVLIISALIFLYVGFNNILMSYNNSFKFNTTIGIYKAKELAEIYKNNVNLQCNYAAKACINDENNVIYNFFSVKNTILLSDISNNSNYEEVSTICDEKCQKFLNNVKTNTDYARLLVIYKNNTYSSVLIK